MVNGEFDPTVATTSSGTIFGTQDRLTQMLGDRIIGRQIDPDGATHHLAEIPQYLYDIAPDTNQQQGEQ